MGICIGHDNGFYQGSGQICIGANNLMKNTVKSNAIVIGWYNEGQQNCIQLGNYSTTSTLPTNATKFIVGCGSGTFNQRNAIECATGASAWTGNNDPITLIKYNLGLNNATTSNKAFVNAITPPQDPNNVTQDDRTLVTKSFLPNFTLQSQKMLEYTDIAQAPTIPTDGTSFDFSPYIPSWAKHIWVYFKWEGESHTEDIMVGVNDGVHLDAQQYDTTQPTTARIEHDHVRMDYNAANKTLTAIDYWYYELDINTNTISNIDTTLANCPPIYVMSILTTA